MKAGDVKETAKKASPKKKKTKSKKNAVDSQTIEPKVITNLVRAEMIEATPLDGQDDYLGTGGERHDDDTSSNMLDICQLRHVLAVSVTTPLTSKRVPARTSPQMRSVGGTRKERNHTSRACAPPAGCALYNLSPDRIARAEAREKTKVSAQKCLPIRKSVGTQRRLH